MFDEELDFFIKNQAQLVAQHRGCVLAIRGREVVGVYPTALDAYLQAQERFPLGTFMLQACQPGPEAYTVKVSSLNLTPA